MMITPLYGFTLPLISVGLWHLWKRIFNKPPLMDIPGPPSGSWWAGNSVQIFGSDAWDFLRYLSKTFGPTVRTTGIMGAEQLCTSDPLALQHIFVKYQHIYEETDSFIVTNRLVFGISLLSTLGEQHRKQRKMLNPVFSLKHMRGLIPVFYPIAHKLRDILASEIRKNDGKDINVLMWMSRAALEYIGQGGLGYSFDALDENKANKYSEVVREFSNVATILFPLRDFAVRVDKLGPAWLRRKLFVDWSPSKYVRQMRDIVDMMDKTSKEVIDNKKQALAKGDGEVLNQIGQGKDIMSILLKANVESQEGGRVSEQELLGHMNTFIFAGHETSSTAVSRVLHQLTLHQDVQDKLRKEVSDARTQSGDLDYDTLMNLPYLDAVVRETLRVFPPISVLLRSTREDVTLPLAWPIKSADGKREIDAIPLKKGTEIVIPVLHANTNTRVWGPDAEEWKPERWLSPLPESVAKAHMPGVYASMMTFIGGGRACIGFKFAEMEIKLVLSILLEAFVFSPGSREIYWYSTGISSPGVKGEAHEVPRLPLNLSFAKA